MAGENWYCRGRLVFIYHMSQYSIPEDVVFAMKITHHKHFSSNNVLYVCVCVCVMPVTTPFLPDKAFNTAH